MLTRSYDVAEAVVLPMTRDVAQEAVGPILEVYHRTKLETWKDWEAANVMMDLPHKWEFSLLLLHDHSPVGFLIASVYGAETVHIHQMAVLGDYQGIGGGKSLLTRLIQLADEKGMRDITLETRPGTEAAQGLYASMGFEVIQDAADLNAYLINKGKLWRDDGYYPIVREGVKVWSKELRKKRVTARALFISPHTDDVELGAGGTVARFVASHEVHVAAFSDAWDAQPESLPENTLLGEMRQAMEVLGVGGDRVHVLKFRTRHFQSARQRVLDEMIRIRDRVRPDFVFAPSTRDSHQDHQVVINEVLRAFKGSRTTILGYELPWNNLSFETTGFVALDEEHINKKLAALSQYRSQQHRRYLNEEFIRGLASVRGTQIGSKYAEAFEVMRVML